MVGTPSAPRIYQLTEKHYHSALSRAQLSTYTSVSTTLYYSYGFGIRELTLFLKCS